MREFCRMWKLIEYKKSIQDLHWGPPIPRMARRLRSLHAKMRRIYRVVLRTDQDAQFSVRDWALWGAMDVNLVLDLLQETGRLGDAFCVICAVLANEELSEQERWDMKHARNNIEDRVAAMMNVDRS